MVAKVGKDLFGPATVKNFESMGIDSSHVTLQDGVSSGVAPIFVDSTGQNRIIVVKGANDNLLPADVDRAAPVLKRCACIVLQLEIPLDTVYYTIRFARENGIRSVLSPAPGQPLDMKEVGLVDYLVPNESEAETISGKPVRNLEEAKSCAALFLEQGVKRVILTLGEKGCLLASKDGMEVVSSFKVKPVDTTGAGDAFTGSFVVFLAEGLPEQAALRRANLYAALSTTKIGTQKSFLSREAFEKEWKAHAETHA